MKKWLNETLTWVRQHFCRKFTVPFHILGGFLCVALIPIFPALGIVLLLSFGLFEWWQETVEGDFGYLDFWDFMFGAFVASIPLIILGYMGLI